MLGAVERWSVGLLQSYVETSFRHNCYAQPQKFTGSCPTGKAWADFASSDGSAHIDGTMCSGRVRFTVVNETLARKPTNPLCRETALRQPENVSAIHLFLARLASVVRSTSVCCIQGTQQFRLQEIARSEALQ